MRPRTTEEKRNFRIACGLLSGATLGLWLISRLVTTIETRQILVGLLLSMSVGVVICFGIYLVRPGWFKQRWKQPQ